MKSNRPLIKATVAFVLACAPALVSAGGGRITFASGQPHIQRGSLQLEATATTPVASGDTIVTPLDSAVQWWMDDDSMLSVVPQSSIAIERHDASQNAADYRINGGGVRIVSGLIKPTVTAPQAKVIATGTDFSSYDCNKGKCGMRSGLYVRVTAGLVQAVNAAGKVDAKPGQIIYAASASIAPIIISSAPRIVLEMFALMEFDPRNFGFVPNVELRPVIRLEGGGPIVTSPTPVPTATTTPTAGPTPTAVPTPTGSSTPTPTGNPTPTAVPTPTGTGVPTPTPTGTPQPTPTPENPGSPS